MESKVLTLKRDNLKYVIVTPDNFENHKTAIDNFDASNQDGSSGERLTKALKNLNEQENNFTVFLLYDISKEKIISYINYCCHGLRIGSDVVPAIKIISFAVDNSYQDKKYNGKLLAAEALKGSLEIIESIVNKSVHAKIFMLFPEDKKEIISFYKRSEFKNIQYIQVHLDKGEIDKNLYLFRPFAKYIKT